MAPVTAHTLVRQAARYGHRLHADANGRYECSMCHWAVRPDLSHLYEMLEWVTTPCVVVQAATVANDASERLQP